MDTSFNTNVFYCSLNIILCYFVIWKKIRIDLRYDHFLKHSNEYKDWDEIKNKYLNP